MSSVTPADVDRSRDRRLSRSKLTLFGFATVLSLLTVGNWLVERAESRGWLSTGRLDDHVRFVEQPLFERRGAVYHTTAYAEEVMVPSHFLVEKADVFRVFLLGESFSMGTPYTSQTHGEERPGGIASWLRLELESRYGPKKFEVINAAAGAQTSHRVRRIAEQVLEFSPDLIVVATCNNEGPPKPSYVREQLHKLGGYRLLLALAAPSPHPSERPTFTPQMIDPEEVRAQFESNVRALLEAAERRGVPVALATLPLHLRYDGEGAPLPPGDEAGRHREDGCVARGRSLFAGGEYEAALSVLRTCESDIADAARWSGLALAALGRSNEARTALALSVELLPLNRCRPSLNAVTRALATEHSSVVLVDLEEAAVELSPQGLPGSGLFVDYCHLNWRGYHAMTKVLVTRLVDEGLLPAGRDPTVDADDLARAWGLEPAAPLPTGGTP